MIQINSKVKAIIIVVILIASSCLVFYAVNEINKGYAGSWYNSGWAYSRKITIDHTKIESTLTNFPILFKDINPEYTHAQADGDDFVFMNYDNTTKYNHEIESFNISNGELIAWVNITSLSSSTDTVLWLYYGNPTCSNQQNKAGTWDSNYKGVYHLNEVSGATCYDSTGNANHGTYYGDLPTDTMASKTIGKGQYFDGNGDYITLPRGADICVQGTVSVWQKEDNNAATHNIYVNYKDLTNFHQAMPYNVSNDINIGWMIASAYRWDLVTDNSRTTNPCFYAHAFDTSTAKLWKDNAAVSTAVQGTSGTYIPTGFRIGASRADTPTNYFLGWMDEFRVSNIRRSDNYLNTSYQNQNSPSTFMTIGAQRTQTGGLITWWDTNWLYSKKITIDHTKVSGTLTNFPVLIKDTDVANFIHAQSDGDDFIFVNSDNTSRYFHELESFSSATDELIAWVNITSLSSTTDTVIWMYWGNPGVSKTSSVNTWDSNYMLVYHFNEAATPSVDSTANAKSGTWTNTVAQYTSSKIGSGIDLTLAAAAGYINNADFTLADRSVEGWVNYDSIRTTSGSNLNMFFYWYDKAITTPTFGSYINTADSNHIQLQADSTLVDTNIAVSTGTWYHIGLTYNNATKAYSTFVNGVSKGTGTAATAYDSACLYSPGYPNFNSGDEKADEFRISNIKRSDDWIITGYNSQDSPSTFATYGAVHLNPNGIKWFDANWKYAKKITINHLQVAETLTNFPILVSKTDVDLKGAQADGDDFIFVASDNATRYNHEIESWDSANGILIAWVNITSLSSTTDTILWLYYGNAGCSSQQNKIGTWNSNYISVWHMNGATDGTCYDSTSHSYNSVANLYDSVTGYVGKASSFAGGGYAGHDYVSFGDMAQPADGSLSTVTFEMWIKSADLLNSSMMLSKYDGASSSYASYIVQAGEGKPKVRLYNSPSYWAWQTSSTQLTNNNWAHCAWIVTASTETAAIYVNGGSVAVTKIEDTGTGPTAFKNTIAADSLMRDKYDSTIYYTNGILDEIRISQTVRSAGWITTTYNTMKNQTTFLTFGEQTSNWYNSNWNFRKKITINHNKVDADQANFPILIKTTLNATKVQADGDDILFTTAAGTKLNHEIETYNSGTGELIAWVNVTNVYTAVDTYIYIYYNNSASANQQNVPGTWDSNYKFVSHMDDLTTSTVKDSTTNSFTGTKGAAGEPAEAIGIVGKCQYFSVDRSNALTVSSSMPVYGGGARTIMAWVKNADSSTGNSVFCYGPDTNSHLMAGLSKYTTANFWIGYSWHDCEFTNSKTWPGQWVMATWTYASGITKFYENATKDSIEYSFTPDTTSGTFGIGCSAGWGASYTIYGSIDEFRYSNMARSASYVATCYNTIVNPTTFTSYSAEEMYNAGTGNAAPNTPTGLAPHARQIKQFAILYATATDDDGDPITMYFYNNATKTEIGHTVGTSGQNISYNWTSITRGTTNVFCARAWDGVEWSANSSVCSFTMNSLPTAVGLMTDNQTDPNRLITSHPYFNWTFSDSNGDSQTKYHIEVGTTDNGNNMWNSTYVTSIYMHATYAGSTLTRGIQYHIRVRVYDGYEWSNW